MHGMNELMFHGKYEGEAFLERLDTENGTMVVRANCIQLCIEADKGRYNTPIWVAVILATFVVKSSTLFLFW